MVDLLALVRMLLLLPRGWTQCFKHITIIHYQERIASATFRLVLDCYALTRLDIGSEVMVSMW